MKLELPFAIFLLAAGCFLWFADGGFYVNTPSPAKKNQKTNVPQGKIGRADPISHPIQLASSEDSRIVDGSQDDSTSNPTESQTLLMQSAANIVSSPPIESTVVLTVDLFDQHLVTQGRYIQLGQGSRKSRLDFEYEQKEIGKLTQICDGRFFYSIQESDKGKKSPLRRPLSASKGRPTRFDGQSNRLDGHWRSFQFDATPGPGI